MNLLPRPRVKMSPSWDVLQAEMEKDVWDARVLGCRYDVLRSNYFLDFTDVPIALRPHAKLSLAAEVSRGLHHHGTMQRTLRHVRNFLSYYARVRPSTDTLRELTPSDMDQYLAHLTPTARGAL